jgi:hypothetical protein
MPSAGRCDRSERELSTLVGDLVDLTRDDAGVMIRRKSTWPTW